MKNIITSPYRKLKVLLVLPVFAIVLYAFAIPEYNYVPSGEKTISPLTIFETTPIIQKVVKGIVTNKEGKPLQGVYITSTGTSGNARMSETGSDGRFIIEAVQPDASLLFFNRGYKQLTLKPDFNAEMRVIMDLDPEYKPPVEKNVSYTGIQQRPEQVVTIDGVISEKNYRDAKRDLGYDFGQMKLLPEKEATEKYGDKGINGIIEITTRKKALEIGMKTPFPRLAPTDFPTFSNQENTSFVTWVISQAKYPVEAQGKKIEGYVSVNYTVEMDGTLSNVNASPSVDPILGNEIVRVIKSSPRWDPPKNPNVDEPLTTSLSLRFKLPDQIEYYEEPFVVVEEMPMYPGGDGELLKYLNENTKYPDAAKAEKIQGRVIIRFFVSTEGTAEQVTVLKGVDPRLDAEAIRVVRMLKGFKPGMQGGKAVNVWYMVPITFTLPKSDTPQ